MLLLVISLTLLIPFSFISKKPEFDAVFFSHRHYQTLNKGIEYIRNTLNDYLILFLFFYINYFNTQTLFQGTILLVMFIDHKLPILMSVPNEEYYYCE